MSEETKVGDISEGAAETNEPELIEAKEAEELNRKVVAVAVAYFQAMASISVDELYEMAYTEAGKDSVRLLEIINSAYTSMLEAGGDLPQSYFDYYKQVVTNFNNTVVFNLSSKLDANKDTLVAIATGKTEDPDRISHNDIIRVLEEKA